MPSAVNHPERYGADYRELRAHWKQRIDAGETVPCWRGGGPITKATPWDLGHEGEQTRGPEHRHRTPGCCEGNRAEGAARGNRERATPPGTPSRTW